VKDLDQIYGLSTDLHRS